MNDSSVSHFDAVKTSISADRENYIADGVSSVGKTGFWRKMKNESESVLMYIYRPHRGGLAESMNEAKEFNTKEEMFEHIVATQGNFDEFHLFNLFDVEDLDIGSSSFSDSRIGWFDTRYVRTKRYGDEHYIIPQCVGMCATQYVTGKVDSNVKDAPVTRHIDALGCIHIPEDIRKSLGLRTNDELEFCAAEDGILIKKCDEVKNLEDFRDSLAKAKCLVEKAQIWYGHTTKDAYIADKLIDAEYLITSVLSLSENF